MTHRIFTIITAAIISKVCGQLCQSDADCTHIGGLYCVRSMCAWGLCGCPGGMAIRYMGLAQGFQCVQLKGLNDKCSPDGSGGLCGTNNSRCVDGRCACDANYEVRGDVTASSSQWCAPYGTPYAGEWCTPGGVPCATPGTRCLSGNQWWGSYSGALMASLPDSPLDGLPSMCYCGTGFHVHIGTSSGDVLPTCVQNAINDICAIDADCSQIEQCLGEGAIWTTGNAVCRDNTCQCQKSADAFDISGMFCGPPLGYGQACASLNGEMGGTGVCDGSKGLRCGNPCEVETFTPVNGRGGGGNWNCTCDPSWMDTGRNCTRVTVGAPCFGDLNCKSLTATAVCVNGQCQLNFVKNAASSFTRKTIQGILIVLFIFIHHQPF